MNRTGTLATLTLRIQGHASCGADAAWSIITLVFSTIYGLLSFIAWKNLTAEADVAATGDELESQSTHNPNPVAEKDFGGDGDGL